MAEVKNAFIKSKMNQDLDGRLLPSGEYREGVNIQVSKSEGPDVGALENVRGNELIADFRTLTGVPNIDVIGQYTDITNNVIYVFLTNYTDPTVPIRQTYNPNTADNFIFSYNISTGDAVQLIGTSPSTSSSWLNFSKNNPIYGINVLEDLLFWTDNRNQPRKLNISDATLAANPSSTTNFSISNYYTLEEQISVAKLYPYQCAELYRSNGAVPPVYSTSMLDAVSEYLPNGGLGTANGSGTNTVINILTASVQGQITTGAIVSSSSISSSPTIVSIGSAVGNVTPITLSASVSWTNNQKITFNANPDYEANYPGDPDYLRNKFVRFSYRYKFADGEYSPFAPFTQAAFIPQQDGYFLAGDEDNTFRSTVVDFMQNKVNKVILSIPLPSTNISNDYKIQEIDILYKESDSLAVTVLDTILNSALPTNANFIDYQYQSRKPFRTLPESALIRVYDKVPVKAFSQEISGNRVIYGNFQDKHTPPNQLSYNVGAFAKEDFAINTVNPSLSTTSIVEYPMHTLKQNRNYQVGVVLSDKFGRSSTVILSSINIGDVLNTGGNGSFGGATYFHPYKGILDINSEDNKVSTWAGDSLKVLFNEPGIPVSVNRNDLPGYPGLYEGNASAANYNPLGWYSYKIVVKQFEQEYYNAYLPGILNGYPAIEPTSAGQPDPLNSTAFITLINDNINKIPRDLSEVGPEQKQYRSSVQLYGRVTPNGTGLSTDYNQQFYPGTDSNTVNTVGEQNFILGVAVAPVSYEEVYQTTSNPYLGRITQTPGNPIGSQVDPISTAGYSLYLGVYETAPVESRINIFWETSTTGLVSDLNAAIISGVPSLESTFYQFLYGGKESDAPGTYVSTPFAPQISGTVLNPPVLEFSSVTLTNIIRGSNTVVPTTGSERLFELQKFPKGTNLDGLVFNGTAWSAGSLSYDSYALKTAPSAYFYYGPSDQISQIKDFQFIFSVTENDSSGNVVKVYDIQVIEEGVLENASPIITNTECTTGLIIPETGPSDGVFITMTGNNGMPTGAPDSLSNLTWSLDPSSDSNFSIDPINGGITTSTIVSGPVNLTVVLTDAAGAEATCNLSPTFGELPVNCGFGQGELALDKEQISVLNTESATLVWVSSVTNALATLDQTFNTAPYSALAFSADAPLSTTTKSQNVSGTDKTGATKTGVFKNTVYNTTANSTCSVKAQADGGITQGTGFVTVEVNMIQSNTSSTYNNTSPDELTLFAMPIELQYRANTAATWVTATDIEGRNCIFTGSNNNSYRYSSFNTTVWNSSDGAANGYITDESQANQFDTYQQDIQSESPTKASTQYNTLQGTLQVKESSSSASIGLTSVITFAIGQSQSYGDQYNKFGDYRLIMRYPYSSVLTEDGSGDPETTLDYIVLGYDAQANEAKFPTNDWDDLGYGLINFKATWGDFYYPNYTPTAISYQYQITALGANSAADAAIITNYSYQEIFAREWDMRYVSQFYTDAALTTKWTPTNYSPNTAWYGYKPVSPQTVNAKQGTSNSNSGNFKLPISSTNPDGFDNIDRKWVAYFEIDGKKAITQTEPVPLQGG